MSYMDDPRYVRLRSADCELLLDTADPGLPRVLHWGADLGQADLAAGDLDILDPTPQWGGPDDPIPLTVAPLASDGWPGRPAIAGSRAGYDFSPAFHVTKITVGEDHIVVVASDPAAQLGLVWRASFADGLLCLRAELTNDGESAYEVAEVALTLPLPDYSTELLDFTGRWPQERAPQRHTLPSGTWLRETRHGRPGFESPLVLCAGQPGLSFRAGQVWGVHIGWSGDSRWWVERRPSGAIVLAAGELLAPGEVRLEPGATYQSPPVYFAWSDDGLDGLAARFHAWIRARPSHPRTPRPVILNTWEAVYFDHDLDRLTALADAAAKVGVERFVLDDGWFRGRVNDSTSLGDWYVDERRWPHGLHPLVEHVRGHGMQFGLWVEPEMVSPDSDLYRAHPEWVLRPGERLPPVWRRQQVLDLANPAAFAYIFDRLDGLVREYRLDYLKWDQNRDLVEAGHDGRPGVRAQTLATYELMDRLRAAHPELEIESCSSGGGRVDLGILARTDRVWASDNTDALERQTIQRWTGQLLPPELIGAHICGPMAHLTGRRHDLSFRFATAAFGHLGLEWDVSTATPFELDVLAEAIAWWKRVRGLLHTGRLVRADHPDQAAYVHGVVAEDAAIFAYVQLRPSQAERPARVRLPGLDPSRRYVVRPVHPAGAPRPAGPPLPTWWRGGSVALTGRVLAVTGIEVPVIAPEQAILLELSVI
jgi:alpha-galactosidase